MVTKQVSLLQITFTCLCILQNPLAIASWVEIHACYHTAAIEERVMKFSVYHFHPLFLTSYSALPQHPEGTRAGQSCGRDW